MGTFIEYAIGQYMGETRLRYMGDAEKLNPRIRRAVFLCDCGNEIVIPIAWVRHNNTSSCGCYRKEVITGKNTKHSHAIRNEQSGAYRSWQAMHQRIKSNPYYKHIYICDAWYDFNNFFADMGDRPDGLTIERVNNDGDYEPSNCVWANHLTQANNTSSNVLVTLNGETHSINEWCRIKGIGYYLIKQRRRRGMSLEDALCVPVNKTKSNKRK